MSFALAAVVVASVASFPVEVNARVLGQKVEVIKGGKKSTRAKQAEVIKQQPLELPQQAIVDRSKPPTADATKGAEPQAAPSPGAKGGATEEERAKEAEEQAKAEKLKAEQQKQIQKIGEQNRKLWEQSTNALGGSTTE